MRAVVVPMKDTHAYILMNNLADDYDKIADKNERQATKTISQNSRLSWRPYLFRSEPHARHVCSWSLPDAPVSDCRARSC